jgi:hypothetical protein
MPGTPSGATVARGRHVILPSPQETRSIRGLKVSARNQHDGEPLPTPPGLAVLPPTAQRAPRGPEDDFFCLRYEVWYPSVDCAVRTKFKTAPGCRNCEQGRFNLKRHHAALARTRFPLPCAE